MNRFFLALAAAIVLPAALPLPAFAQDGAASAEQGDPHLALASALTNEDFIEVSFDKAIVAGFDAALRLDSELAGLDAECPGLIAGMAGALRPVLLPAYRADFAGYRTRIHALFQREMSAENAAAAAQFFDSPLGRRFMLALANNLSLDSQAADAFANDDESISREAMERDSALTARQGLQAMELLEQREVGRILSTEAWAKDFVRLQPIVSQYQLEMANSDYPPEVEAEIDATIEKSADTLLDACLGPAAD